MNRVEIQVQYNDGMWQTFNVVDNDSQLILWAMQGLKQSNPKARVRAVDQQTKQLIDMLP